jgi:hypothetical protein
MNDHIECRQFLIAYIDVLGQRERLRQLRTLPTTLDEHDEAFTLVRSTAGFVITLRKQFAEFFEQQNKPTSAFNGLEAELRKQIQAASRCVASSRGVSDSVIISVPILPDYDHYMSLSSIYAALGSICAMMVTSLSMHHAVRGGVDIGIGLRITNDEIYGPALERACYLEAEVARWPRVVVGSELWAYLSEEESTELQTPWGKMAREYACDSKKLVTQTDEGDLMLDFLGSKVKGISPALRSTVPESAYSFVVHEHERFARDRNEKLEVRYRALRLYFESKLALWGIDPSEVCDGTI